MPRRRARTLDDAKTRYHVAVGSLNDQMARNLENVKQHGGSLAIRSVDVYSLKRAIGEYEAAVRNLDRFAPGFRE